jgi:hypothetical protein
LNSLYIRLKFLILKNNIAKHKKIFILFSIKKKSFLKKKIKIQKVKINKAAKPNLKSGAKLNQKKILKKESKIEINSSLDL